MGGSSSTPADVGLEQEEVDALCATTPLDEEDVIVIRSKFLALAPDADGRVSRSRLERMAEVAVNPLGSRLCHVFSGTGDGSLDFVEFVDMFSCMSKSAPADVKLSVAFRIYDIDGDGFIGRDDVQRTLELIAGAPGNYRDANVTVEVANTIVARVLAEGDFDGNEKISPTEFTKLLRRVPDFGAKFTMTIAKASER
jgi:Ca2+-binding EF-hand superfamily protein